VIKTNKKIDLIFVKHLISKHFNLNAKAKRLNGEIDCNYLISIKDEYYYLKIYPAGTSPKFVNYQIKILDYLEKNSETNFYPRNIKNNQNKKTGVFEDNTGQTRIFRLNSWTNGRLWSNVNPVNKKLRNNLGQSAGRLTRELKNFKISKFQINTDWDLAKSLWTIDYLDLFKNIKQKKIIKYFQKSFLKNIEGYNKLRKSFIHNDINDNNIIISNDISSPKIIGIIDFGDTIYSQTINDLAITCVYAIINCNLPLEASLQIIKTYNNEYRLNENELFHLYNLIGMRLVTSLTKSAINKINFKDNKYLQISEKPAWNLIETWYNINQEFAYYSFRNACGFNPHPNYNKFKFWSKKQTIKLKDIFPNLIEKKIENIDLSVGSTWLGNSKNFEDLDLFENKLNLLKLKNKNKLICGGYLEARKLYNTKNYERLSNNGIENRTIHLGIDFWLPSSTPVNNLFDGVIDSITIDNKKKGYGGLIIVKHKINDFNFYTLFGHLSYKSFIYKKGDQIKKGELIGYIGNRNENGNWVPHLHFQVLLSKLNYLNDFPGVSFNSEKKVFKSICPDPNYLFDQRKFNINSKSNSIKMIEFRKKYLGKNLSLQYENPLHFVSGSGVYLLDNMGQKYLDTLNNIAHVGHENFNVVKSGQNQMALLNTNTRYLHNNINILTKNLLAKFPTDLFVVYYVNSGSEANELAVRMAETFTNSKNFIVSEGGYHGSTNKCIELSHYKFSKKGGFGKSNNIHVFPLTDTLRGKYSGKDSTNKYINEINDLLVNINKKNQKVAGIILEPIISCAGQIELPENFLKSVYKLIRKNGGVCISDEIQTGLGRVGEKFWGFELYDVIPDIVTIGKSFGNGHPVSAVVCKREISEKFNNGMEFFSSFGGNPVSCAIANEVLIEVKSKKLQLNANKIGEYLINKLLKLSKKYPIIAQIRGKGLFLGFELTNRDLVPLPKQTKYLINRMLEFKILLSRDGLDKNVIKIKPPLTFDKKNTDYLISCLDIVLNEDYMKLDI